MSAQAWIMVVILAALFALLIWDRVPVWAVFMGALTATMTLKLAPTDALLKGFSNTGVLTVAALFPVAAGMYATGAISLLSQRLIGMPETLGKAQLKIMVPVAAASAFLYNTPLVAMMIPVVRDLSRTTGLPKTKLFMGLSFASILGGTMTLVGTSVNLIIAGLVTDAIAAGRIHGMKPLGIFTPIGVGLPVTVAGLTFMFFIGSRLLPGEKGAAGTNSNRRMYRSEFRIEAKSNFEAKSLQQAGLTNSADCILDSVVRDGALQALTDDLRLQRGDILTFLSLADVLPGLWTTIGLVPNKATGISSPRHRHRLVELVVAAASPAIGHRISKLPLPGSPYEMMLVGVSRNGKAPRESLNDIEVKPGDAAVVEVGDSFFYESRRETDFILTKTLEGYQVQRVDRAMIATIITVAMVGLAAFSIMSLLNAALLATGAMLLTGCVTSDRVWRSVDWQILVVMGAAVGLESAVSGSGLSQIIADGLGTIGGDNPIAALGAVFVGTVVLTNIITNTAAAAFMFPVALTLANRLGVNFTPFAVILMVGASCAFVNPAGFQTNLMVQGPAGYAFSDFAKVGLPLTIVVAIVVLLMAPIVYGF